MQKIALFVPSLRGGGAERVMVLLANGLARSGHEVELVVATPDNAYASAIAPDVTVCCLGVSRVAASLPALVRYLRLRRPDTLVSAMGHANVVAVLAGALARGGTRVVVTEHTLFSAGTARRGGLNARVLRAIMKRCYLRADAIVAVSRGVADDLAHCLGLHRRRIDVVYNPVVDECLYRQASQPIKGDVTVLAAGRLVRSKGFETLIDAFAVLRRQGSARLTILGEGPLRTTLSERAAERGVREDLDMPGFVDNPYAYMSAAGVFVVSSEVEGLSNVLVEAMACGAPVVSTDCPSGPREVLEDGRWGRLVPVGDAQALASAMSEALEGGRCLETSARVEAFSVDRAVAAYLEILQRPSSASNRRGIDVTSRRRVAAVSREERRG